MNRLTVGRFNFLKSCLKPAIAVAMLAYSLPSSADLKLTKTIGETSLIDSITDLAASSQGSTYVLDGAAKKVHKINSAGQNLLSWDENDGLSLAANQLEQVYIRTTSGIKKLTKNGKLLKKISLNSSSVDAAYAKDLAIDKNNYVYINMGKVIHVYDSDLVFIKTIKTYTSSSAVKFNLIKTIAFNKNNNLFVQTNAAILQLDENNKLINRLLLSKLPINQAIKLYNLAFDASGNPYISDLSCDCIKQLDWQGNVVKTLGGFGSLPSQYYAPTVLAFDKSNQLIVGDTGNFRVQKIALAGAAVWTTGDESNKFKNPADFALDLAGNLYLLDQGHARVQKYSADGVWLGSWGSRGNQAGQLATLSKISINPNNNSIYIQDSYLSDGKNLERTQIFNTDGGFLGAYYVALPSFDMKENSYRIVLKSKTPPEDNSTYYDYIFGLQKMDSNADLLKEWEIKSEESTLCSSPGFCSYSKSGPIISSLAINSKDDIYYLNYYSDNYGQYLSLNRQSLASTTPNVLINKVPAVGVANLLVDSRDFTYMGFFEDSNNLNNSGRRMAVYDKAFELIGHIYQTFSYPNSLYDHGYVASATDKFNKLYLLNNQRLEVYTPALSLKAPTLISAKVMDAKGTVKLTWTDRTSDESGFNIKVCSGQGVNCADKDMITVKTVGANRTSAVLPALAVQGSGVIKTFRMTSLKGNEESLVSNELELTY